MSRISDLPRRDWERVATPELVEDLTDYFRTPHGTMRLRSVQAAALAEIAELGGAFLSVAVGGGKCVDAATLIRNPADGTYSTVADVVRRRQPFVDSWTVLGQDRAAIGAWHDTGEKRCIRLTFGSGRELVVTPEHPLMMPWGWARADELVVGDTVACARQIPEPTTTQALTPGEVFALAIFYTEGECSHDQPHFSTSDPEILRRAAAFAESQGCRLVHRGQYDYAMTRPRGAKTPNPVSSFIVRNGINCLAKVKRVPTSVWSLPNDQLASFLAVVWMCDGHIDTRGRADICLASRGGVDDLQRLLLRFGIQARVRYKRVTCGGKVFDSWRLVVTSDSMRQFDAALTPLMWGEKRRRREEAPKLKHNPNCGVPRIKPELAPKLPRGSSWSNTAKPRWALPDAAIQPWQRRVYWDDVIAISDAGVRHVYDLTVPATGCFLANDFVAHNTLISALTPVALEAKRPVIVVPSGLVQKTVRELDELRLHWKIPQITVVGYSTLSHKKHANWLFVHQPDVIVFDESHALKTASQKKGAAVAKRVLRYLQHAPDTRIIAMTGTIAKDSIRDYAHIIVWCLGERSPVPLDSAFQDVWAECLDVRKPGVELFRPSFSVLEKDLGGPIVDLEDARERYALRLRQSPGIIISTEGYNEVPLVIIPTYAPELGDPNGFWPKLRDLWIAPDDFPLGDAKTQIWSMARDLSRGFFRYHDPWPPEPWMEARRAWAGFVRTILEDPATLWDSEAQVEGACASGILHSDAYERWKQIEPTHEVVRKTQWYDRGVVEFVKNDVLRKFGNEGGIVWTWQDSFARALAKRTGWDYYGSQGLNTRGEFIDDAKSQDVIIASIQANMTGRNLQYNWRNNYITCPPPANWMNEQLLGRTHRPGQPKNEVRAWYLFACKEDIDTFRMAIAEAQFAYQTTKQRFKLLDANITQPTIGPGLAYG